MDFVLDFYDDDERGRGEPLLLQPRIVPKIPLCVFYSSKPRGLRIHIEDNGKSCRYFHKVSFLYIRFSIYNWT